MDAETHRLFDRWVVVPFSVLRQLPDGDGAFAALAMGFGLYERFIDSKIHNRGDKPCPERRYEEAAKDFEDRVKAEDFKSFWDMYRVGFNIISIPSISQKAMTIPDGAGIFPRTKTTMPSQ
jgi:hypothetical protein